MRKIFLQHRPKFSSIVAGCLLLGILWMVWELLFPHVYESRRSLSAAEARQYSPIEIPPGAKNVRIATYRDDPYGYHTGLKLQNDEFIACAKNNER